MKQAPFYLDRYVSSVYFTYVASHSMSRRRSAGRPLSNKLFRV